MVVGKTNVYWTQFTTLSFAKSYFNPIAVQNIQHILKSFLSLREITEIDDRSEKIICSLKKGQKESFENEMTKTYEKFSDHIGQIPLVIISPS